MDNLNDKVALVTVSSRGIGRAIALALAGEGADVAINFVQRAAEAEAAELEIRKLGRRCVSIQADVSDAKDVKRLVESTENALGPIDILVNNAGIARPQPIEEIAEEDWDQILTGNLKSCFLMTQAVLPGMRERKWGRIVNVSSVAAQVGGVCRPALRRFEGRHAGSDALLCAKVGCRRDYVKCHCSCTNRHRDGQGESECPAGSNSRRPLWNV